MRTLELCQQEKATAWRSISTTTSASARCRKPSRCTPTKSTSRWPAIASASCAGGFFRALTVEESNSRRNSPSAKARASLSDSGSSGRRAHTDHRRLPAKRRHFLDAVARGRADRPDDHRHFARKPDACLDPAAAVGRGNPSRQQSPSPVRKHKSLHRRGKPGCLRDPELGIAWRGGNPNSQRRLGRAARRGLCDEMEFLEASQQAGVAEEEAREAAAAQLGASPHRGRSRTGPRRDRDAHHPKAASNAGRHGSHRYLRPRHSPSWPSTSGATLIARTPLYAASERPINTPNGPKAKRPERLLRSRPRKRPAATPSRT